MFFVRKNMVVALTDANVSVRKDGSIECCRYSGGEYQDFTTYINRAIFARNMGGGTWLFLFEEEDGRKIAPFSEGQLVGFNDVIPDRFMVDSHGEWLYVWDRLTHGIRTELPS